LSVEYTDDPHPRNVYWDMWGLPMFTIKDGAAVLFEVKACRKAHPNHYIKVNAFDNTRGVESMCLSFIVNRPKNEPGSDSSGRKRRAAGCATRHAPIRLPSPLGPATSRRARQ